MRLCYQSLRRFLVEEHGPAAVEYAVMLGLVVVICVTTISMLGINTKVVCNAICTALGNK